MLFLHSKHRAAQVYDKKFIQNKFSLKPMRKHTRSKCVLNKCQDTLNKYRDTLTSCVFPHHKNIIILSRKEDVTTNLHESTRKEFSYLVLFSVVSWLILYLNRYWRKAKHNIQTAKDAFLKAKDAFPKATDAFPMSTDAFPKATDCFPIVTDAFPRVTEGFLRATDAFPVVTDAFPTATD
jgi:hypothetical protein